MTGSVTAIASFLRSRHIKVPNEWVEACVEWLQEEHQSSGESLGLDKLKRLVYEQWLVADLTELGIQYLPQEVTTADKYSLSGHYCLQVNGMIDISTSYYSQHVKLKGIDISNSTVTFDEPKKAAWQPPHTRMMKLELTDGTTKVHAMEYSTIPDLKPGLKPGFKVLIEGDVLCRKGILLLKRENIQVLGGEVDSLMETNTPQQLLTKAMEECGSYAGESVRREFTADDVAQFADRINHVGYKQKKGHDLPGTHNTKTGNSSRYAPGKSTSWNSKSLAPKTESSKPKLMDFEDFPLPSHFGADNFEDEWEADDLNYEELDDALMTNTDQSSRPSSSGYSSNNPSRTPQQQQKNKKRSFSPYEANEPSAFQKSKNFRQSTSPPADSSTRNNNNGRLPTSPDFDDDICEDNWDDDEMEMALAMDAAINPKPAFSKKSSVPKRDSPASIGSAPLQSSSSSSSSSRHYQLSSSTIRPSSQPDQAMELDTDSRLKSSSLTVNSSIDDIVKKWLKLCEKKSDDPSAYSDLMKVEHNRLPFTYLFVLQGCQLPDDSCKFRIKGYVSTLLGKLERTNNKWKLMCTLNDGTGTLPVQLSDEVLIQLIGYSVQQSIEMTSAGSDPSLKKKLQEGVKQCQLKIVNLCSIFEIETNKTCSHPLVTKITSLNAGHIQQLRKQVTNALAKV